MHTRPARAAIAAATLASATLLGAAPTASAASQSTSPTCEITASLTGLAGKTLVAGGAPIAGNVSYTNVSGKTLTTFGEILTAGPVHGTPNNALKIQGEHGGKWITLSYMTKGVIGFHYSSPGDDHLAAGNVDSAPLLVSAPKGTPAGTYAILATSGGDNIGPLVTHHAQAGVPTQASGCKGGLSMSLQTFKVVTQAPGTPSATPSPVTSATPSASASPSASAPASTSAPVPSASSGSGLAETGGGSDSELLAAAAAALIAAGAGAFVLTRPRRGSQHH